MDANTAYRLSPPEWIGTVLIVTFGMVLAWQAMTYGPPFSTLSEWQFATLGRAFPALTIAGVFLGPSLLVLGFARWRRRREAQELSPPDFALLNARRMLRALTALIVGLGVATLVALALSFAVPTDESESTRIDALGTPNAKEGGATVLGPLKADRVVVYEQRIGLAARTILFAPIDPGAARPLRYFVERPATMSADAPANAHLGVVIRKGVPGPVLAVYAAAGYRIADPAVAVMLGRASGQWIYYAAAMQTAIVALLLLIVATYQRRHIRRLREKLVQQKLAEK